MEAKQSDRGSPDTVLRPLIPLFFAFSAGIILARFLPGASLPALAAAGFSAAACIYRFAAKQPSRWLPLLLYAALGCLSLSPWHLAPQSPDHITAYTQNAAGERQITGTVAAEPLREGHRLKFPMTNICLADNPAGKCRQQVRGNLRVTVYGRPQSALTAGDRICFPGTIKPLHNFNNPGGFDYKAFMAFRNIYGSSYCPADKLRVQARGSPGWLQDWIAEKRRSVRGLIREASVEGDSRAILTTLVLGGRRLLSPGLQSAFNRAGASHILAISGLHIGIVATVSFFLLKSLLLFCRPLRERAACGKAAAALALFPIWGYALLAGMAPSTQRAVIMATVFLASLLMERDRDVANTLAGAGLAIVMIYPPALFSVSFQLSFTAVVAILSGLSAVRPAISRCAAGRRAAVALISFVLVSFFAIIGTTPLTMHYFNQAAFLGIAANLLVIPVIGFLVVPLALFSVLVLFPLHPLPAQLGVAAAGRLLDGILPAIYAIGGLSWSAVKTVTPSVLELCCVYGLLAGLLFLIKARTNPSEIPPSWKKLVVCAVLAAAAVLIADIGYWCHNRYCNTQMRATILDVGQGSAALLELPQGYRMLIDGGGYSNNAIFDIGKNVVAPFLWHRKIGKLDAVVLSHPDADHLNGLLYILRHFSVDRVLSTHQPADSESYQEFLRLIASEDISHPDYSQLSRHLSINGASLHILHPAPNSPCIHSARGKNNCSLVLKACLGKASILFSGDIMATAEAKLARRQKAKLGASVLIAPHHGSKTSSTPQFLDCVHPRAAVFSAGPQNRFHLPAAAVLKRYRSRGCRILVTSSNGAVHIETNGRRIDLASRYGKAMEIGSP